MTMHETAFEWRPIPGWDGYEVSDDGRVRSWKVSRQSPSTPLPRILRPYALPAGYLCVKFKDRGRRAGLYVHHLVALAFFGDRPDGAEVAHYDGNKANNTVANLRYATKMENVADALRHGTIPRGERQHAATVTDATAHAIRAFVGTHAEAARAFGANYNVAYRIRTGRTWVTA